MDNSTEYLPERNPLFCQSSCVLIVLQVAYQRPKNHLQIISFACLDSLTSAKLLLACLWTKTRTSWLYRVRILCKQSSWGLLRLTSTDQQSKTWQQATVSSLRTLSRQWLSSSVLKSHRKAGPSLRLLSGVKGLQPSNLCPSSSCESGAGSQTSDRW